VRRKLDKELNSMFDHMEEEIHKGVQGEVFESMPTRGMNKKDVVALLQSRAETERSLWDTGKHSGNVYIPAGHFGDDLRELQSMATGLFAATNPLHFEAYPMVRQMEGEIVAMTRKLVNGGPECVGCTTYGGTESILLAMKAFRDRGRAVLGVTEPNILICTSAHAAFYKAGQYFNIFMREVPMLENGEMDVAAAASMVDRDTVGIVGSAPNFPQGTIDPIPALGQLALKHDLLLHVDACLGSWVVTFLEAVGETPAHLFDFRVPGVSSMSLDTHKYALTPKGSSVLMYASKDIMHYQYGPVPKWTGGVYVRL
jgi:sphinganine-1-phosphate aldolase